VMESMLLTKLNIFGPFFLEFELNYFFFFCYSLKESVILICVGMLVPAVWLIWKICI